MRCIGLIWGGTRVQKIHVARKPMTQQMEVIICGKGLS
jgi:hypothetical protein